MAEDKVLNEEEQDINLLEAEKTLKKYVTIITENLGDDVLEDSYINKMSKYVPTIVINEQSYFKVAQFLKHNERLSFNYMSNIHASDFETHLEVYAHLFSYKTKQSLAYKVKVDRTTATTASVTPIWEGANWPECEIYDLLGIKFEGHPNLHRILLGDDWVGHPLRKDYVIDDAGV